MKEVQFDLPWPPSINKTYVNATENIGKKTYKYNSQGKLIETKGRGRYLTGNARNYKKTASELIFYSTLGIKFEKLQVEVKIIQFPPDGRKRDRDNGLKIVFDCIEKSGIIDNDNQIIAYEVVEGPKHKYGYWKVFIRTFMGRIKYDTFEEFLGQLTY